MNYFKEKRKLEAASRKLRFQFVREIIKRNIMVDENTDASMMQLWGKIIGDMDSLMTTNNVIRVPALLTRLNRFVEFDYKLLRPEVQQAVRDAWNSIENK